MKLTQRGFTLIEMLIVIVIIGILAAALIPQLTGIQGRARDTGRKADMNNIAGALQSYQLDMNTYPPASGTATSGGRDTLSAQASILAPEYIGVLPEESGAGNMPYQYATTSSNAGFVLGTVSEGGKSNSNWSSQITAASGGGTGYTVAAGDGAITDVPGDITGYMLDPTITKMANAIADCASQDIASSVGDEGCRGIAGKSARYLVAQ